MVVLGGNQGITVFILNRYHRVAMSVLRVARTLLYGC